MLPGDEDPPTTATPPDHTPPDRSKLRQTLHSFRTPFRAVSPFHIASLKRPDDAMPPPPGAPAVKARKKIKKSKTLMETAPETSSTGSEEKKSPRRKGEGAAGALVRKLSSLRRGGKRSEDNPAPTESHIVSVPPGESTSSSRPQPTPPPSPRAPLALPERDTVEVYPQSSEPIEMEPSLPPLPPSTPSEHSPERSPEHSPERSPLESPPPEEVVVPTVVAVQPVSTLPFTKSAWKKNATHEIPRPVEKSSSGETSTRRKITLVAQASTYMSEDRGDEGDEGEEEEEEVGSLERVVELARERLARSSSGGGRHTPDSQHSRADSERDEDMPAYGDLLTADKDPDHMGASSSSHASAPGGERREHLYKILVIGELGTGKTSIIKRYVHQFFSQHYRATIGVDFALKVLNWDANTIIRLQLWDIAGQERFGNMTRVYYKEAVGAFVVFDVTRAATFEAVHKWKSDLDAKVQLPDGSPIPCILLANKCDQPKEGIVNSPAKMEEYCKEKGFAGWFETSAKENVNIEEAARSLVTKILLNDKLLHSNEKDSDRIALEHRIANGNNGTSGSSKNCAC